MIENFLAGTAALFGDPFDSNLCVWRFGGHAVWGYTRC